MTSGDDEKMNRSMADALTKAQVECENLNATVEELVSVSPSVRRAVSAVSAALDAAVGLAHRSVIIDTLVESGASAKSREELDALEIHELQTELKLALNRAHGQAEEVEAEYGWSADEDFTPVVVTPEEARELNEVFETAEAERAEAHQRYLSGVSSSGRDADEEDYRLIFDEGFNEPTGVDLDGAPEVEPEL